jgi:hypothetical protein
MNAQNSAERAIAAARDAERLARELRSEALDRGHAVVVGNRAGIVEWAAEPWRRLTGFPLEQTIDKPISHFLEHAGLEVELVDFVARHFLEGRPCTVALTFDTLDGRTLDLQLDVEPIRSDAGEIDRFVAVVQEQPTRCAVPLDPMQDQPTPLDRPASTPIRPGASAAAERRRHRLRIEPLVAGALERVRATCGPDTLLIDPVLEDVPIPVRGRAPGAPGRAIASARLASLLDRLIDASRAAEAIGPHFLTLVTGRLRPGRSHHSLAHAMPQRSVASLADGHAFLEVHDTAAHLDRAALARIREGAPGEDPREIAWAEAMALAEQLGARLLLDSTPGCGNQALVVFEGAEALPST